ncbi:MAG: hypothetical protein HOY69_38560 [Streptomyces sp.]|nr:hypothetical protein [Streptomyces sp.]
MLAAQRGPRSEATEPSQPSIPARQPSSAPVQAPTTGPSSASTPAPRSTDTAAASRTPRPLPGPPPLPGGLFRLTNVDSDMCLSPLPGNTTPSVGLVQAPCDAEAEQFWKLHVEETDTTGTVVYSIRNRHSDLCLSVDAARKGNDVPVTQYLCGDENGLFPDQFWSFTYDASRHAWKLVSRNSGRCVALINGSGAGDQALQEDCGSGDWTLWRT